MTYARKIKALKVASKSVEGLGADQRGLALVEFAVAFPLFLSMTLYGVELSNYAMTHLRLVKSH